MLQDLQWDGCRKETDYYEKSYGSRRNSNFRDTQVDIEDNSWSVEAGLRTCQNNSSSIRYGGKDISFIRKNGHILRGGERMQVREEGDSMADKVHCIRKTLRLMPQEAKVLSDKAKANGMNEAEYIRLLISQKPNDYPEVRKLLKELINEINRIGININQIVFNSNAQLYSKKDKEQLVAYMKKLNQSVSEAVVKIGN